MVQRLKRSGRATATFSPNSVEPQGGAGQIVSGLLNLAGGVSQEVTRKLNETVEKDKIKQTYRAMNHQPPSEGATRAGYQANLLVAVKREGMKVLEDFKNNPDIAKLNEDETVELLQRSYDHIQAKIGQEYQAVKDDEDLKSAVTMQLQELTPAFVDFQNAKRVELEQTQRYDNAYGLASESISNLPQADVPTALSRIMKASDVMQLSDGEKESIITQLAINSGNKGVYEFAKQYKGSSDQTLFNRSGKLQSGYRRLKSQLSTEQELEYANQLYTISKSYMEGSLTDEEVKAASSGLVSSFGEKYRITPAQLIQWKSARERNESIQLDLTHIDEQIDSGGGFTWTNPASGKPYKREVVQAFLGNKFNQIAAADVSHLPEEEQVQARESNYKQAIEYISSAAKQSGQLYEPVRQDLLTLARDGISTGFKDQLVEVEEAPGVKVQALTGAPAEAVRTLEYMDEGSLTRYADGEQLDYLLRIKGFLSQDMSPAEAVVNANRVTKYPVFTATEDDQNFKGLEAALDDPISWDITHPDISEDSKRLLRAKIYPMMLASEAKDKTDLARKLIADRTETLDDGTVIWGDKYKLLQGMAVGVPEWKTPPQDLNLMIGAARSKLIPLISDQYGSYIDELNISPESIQFDVDTEQVSAQVYFTDKDGFQIQLPKTYSMGELGRLAYDAIKGGYGVDKPKEEQGVPGLVGLKLLGL